ncbi:hypothetical protein V3C99_010414 [Haemonchus contortus]
MEPSRISTEAVHTNDPSTDMTTTRSCMGMATTRSGEAGGIQGLTTAQEGLDRSDLFSYLVYRVLVTPAFWDIQFINVLIILLRTLHFLY